MPDVQALYNHAELEPVDLEARRRALEEEIRATPGGTKYASLELLRELSSIYSVLRRRNSGPPKDPNKARSSTRKKQSLDDLLGL